MDISRERLHQEEMLKVAEQAAEWLIALDDGKADDRAAFAAWIEESPLHVEMFLQASAVNQIGEIIAPADRQALLDAVFARVSDSTVIPLGADVSRDASRADADCAIFGDPSHIRALVGIEPPARRWLGVSPSWGMAAAAAIALVSVAAWLFVAGPLSWDRYETVVGEQRALALRDGSVVYLNTDTRISVRYSKHLREVQLHNGEALFKVEHDPSRPFQVQVNDAMVQAVGTQFDIYRRSSDSTVAVIEGAVQVVATEALSDPAASSHQASVVPHAKKPPSEATGNGERVAAGEAVNLASDGLLQAPVAVNVAQVTAWRQRRLVFEWETLATIAQEFNRYNKAPQIRVEGDGVRARRYTAVFDADSPQTLLKFLARDGDLEFAAEGGDFVIRGR